jgi:Ca2+-binding EF-hand superfamily protein
VVQPEIKFDSGIDSTEMFTIKTGEDSTKMVAIKTLAKNDISSQLSQDNIKDISVSLPQPKGPEFNPEDLMALQGNRDPADTEKWAKKIFSCVDVDGSGSINKKGIKVMLSAFLTFKTKDETDSAELEREVNAAMSEMDVGSDGMINFKEFLQYHLKMNGAKPQTMATEAAEPSKEQKQEQDF